MDIEIKENFKKTFELMLKSAGMDEVTEKKFNDFIGFVTEKATNEEIQESEFYINEIIKSKQKEKSIFD